MRREERKKREAIEAIMTIKKEEQNAMMQKLERSAGYIEAHWRGLLARREMEKVRKKGKKKKKKK